MFESKFLKTVLLAAFIVGGIWLLVNREKLNEPSDVISLAKDTLSDWVPAANNEESSPNPTPDQFKTDASSNQANSMLPSYSTGQGTPVQNANFRKPSQPVDGAIRIGSFRVQSNIAQLRSHEPIRLVAELGRQYDIFVIHNLDRNNSTWVKAVIDEMNRAGAVATRNRPALSNGDRAAYHSVSDRTRREGETQTAMIFNRETVQLDQSGFYIVEDPDDVFEHDPMVAWFRALGPNPQMAFTFSLASIDIQKTRPDLELNQLGFLVRAIRSDGRGEDDVILVGDFQSDDRGLEVIRRQAGFSWVVSRQPTTVTGDRQFDNVMFSEPATSEFTGRGGAVEFHRLYQLKANDALAVSERLPVWAEFSTIEK